MRFVVAALVALFVLAPAAQAQVTFTGVPESPTNLVTFDVGFTSTVMPIRPTFRHNSACSAARDFPSVAVSTQMDVLPRSKVLPSVR